MSRHQTRSRTSRPSPRHDTPERRAYMDRYQRADPEEKRHMFIEAAQDLAAEIKSVLPFLELARRRFATHSEFGTVIPLRRDHVETTSDRSPREVNVRISVEPVEARDRDPE